MARVKAQTRLMENLVFNPHCGQEQQLVTKRTSSKDSRLVHPGGPQAAPFRDSEL